VAQNNADQCRLRALRKPRKARVPDSKVLRECGWPAFDGAQCKASDAIDAAELRCTEFRAHSVGDLAVKLQFAAVLYDLAGAGIDGRAVAAAISDAVRLAQKGGAA
jgi:hypothetical protein